ncbi:MAG: diguanylate cyclase [Deltaproteobacteria bacterium]|nr:diguanylate cyclase [Deltaproteobacteria bacterium]
MAVNRNSRIQADIDKLLAGNSRDHRTFIAKVDRLVERCGNDFFPYLFFTTAHLEFPKRTAKKHWDEILLHWEKMRKCIKREIDFRVALLDYFIDINHRIKNPKIIEIKIFQKTQQESYLDELTQLFNYRYFQQALKNEIVRAQRYAAPLSLVIFDVDDFKNYNDTNGHFAGNQALKKLARTLKKGVRDVDVVVRYGGEEFAILLPETTKEGAMVISERIRNRVEITKYTGGAKQPLKNFTISGGVATLKVDAATGSELIKKADRALYRAKSRGKNQIALYEDERRDFERVSASLVGRLNVISDSGDLFSVKNLSEGGALLIYSSVLPLGSVLHLAFQVPGRKTPIACKAKVTRVEELKKNKSYEIGVRIIQIRERERKSLRRFIASTGRKKGV